MRTTSYSKCCPADCLRLKHNRRAQQYPFVVLGRASPMDRVKEVATLTVALPETAPPAADPLQPTRADRYAQMAVLVVLLAAPALICLHSAVVNDPDIWWHLRAGEWIVRHHSIPQVDAFSSVNAGKAWPDYSWLYELLTFGLFERFGLMGIVGYSAAMVLAVTVALYHLVRRLQGDFSVLALLTFAGCFMMGHLFTPRPWLFTILFFVLEIDILMRVRRTGRLRELAWLPLIFLSWSNIHIQFIDGLVVLGIALVEAVATRKGIGEKTQLGIGPAAAALGASLVATLANPFGWHIYHVAYDLASQPGVLNKINELKAIPFRDMTDWSILAMTLISTAILSRARTLRIFESGLLAFAIFVGFRSQRDVWVIAAAVIAILASSLPARKAKAIQLPRFATVLAAMVAALIVLGGFRLMKLNNTKLETQVEATYPVKAVAAIQANGYPGPLFNDFNWGGYLIWSLRMPVSIDGRAAFYGDQAIDRSVATWGAETAWNTDPLLKQARIIIGPAKGSLIQVLRLDSAYRLVYEDKIAAVFIRR